MADIELVIKIPEEDLDAIEKLKSKGWASRHELRILNGIRLPKGHGDLIDRNDLLEYTNATQSAYVPVVGRYQIITADTIIPAESED